MIAEGDIVTSTGGTTKMRVNIDKTAYYGFETGISLYLCRYFSAGGTLSVNRYEVKEGASGYHVEGNFPRATAGVYMVITPFAAFTPRPLQTLTVTPAFEYEGPRYSRFTRLGTGAVMDRYLLVSVKLSSELNGHFTVSSGIENLFDANYSLTMYTVPCRAGLLISALPSSIEVLFFCFWGGWGNQLFHSALGFNTPPQARKLVCALLRGGSFGLANRRIQGTICAIRLDNIVEIVKI